MGSESIVNTGRSMEMELDALVAMDYQNYGVHPWACTRPASGNYILIVQLSLHDDVVVAAACCS